MSSLRIYLFVSIMLLGGYVCAADVSVKKAQAAALKGDYKKALKALSASTTADAVLMRAQIMTDTGADAEAIKLLTEAIAAHPADIRFLAARGEAYMVSGAYAKAEADLLKAVSEVNEEPKPGEMMARLTLLKLYKLFHREDDIYIESGWFFDYYSVVENDDLSAQQAYCIGAGASIAGDEFNGIKVAALGQRKDPDYYPATIAVGDIFLKKYQYSDAIVEYERVLEKNPNFLPALIGNAQAKLEDHEFKDAEIYAKRALEINPHAINAYLVLAMLDAYDDAYDDALKQCDAALAINPYHPEALITKAALAYTADRMQVYEKTTKHLAAVYARILGFDEESPLAEVHPAGQAALEIALSSILSQNHRVDEALVFARKAVKNDPQSLQAQSNLAVMLMRHGLEEEAEPVLALAAELDPYNVWVHNLRKLVKRNNQYKVFKVGRFFVRIHENDAPVFGEEAAALAESQLQKCEAIYGVKIDKQIRLSILKSQADFAARITGLPRFDADGATFGPYVAIVTPADGLKKSYNMNWKSVQLHELAHVVTLMGSKYRLPRWLGEGMSVYAEGWYHPSRDIALKTLLENGPQPDLRTWNRSFNRPEYFWQIAGSYMAAGLFVEWFAEDYGKDKLPLLVKLYGEGKSTEEVFQAAVNLSVDEMNAWFGKRLDTYAKTLHSHILVDPSRVEEEAALFEENTENEDVAIYLLRAYRMRRDAEQAEELSKKIVDGEVLQTHPKGIAKLLAYETLGELMVLRENAPDAISVLEKGIDVFQDAPRLHHMLGLAYLQQKESDAAKKSFRKAIELYPRFLDAGEHQNPYQALATLLHDEGETKALTDLLARYTDLHRGDPVALRWLAEQYVVLGELENAAATYELVFAIDPYQGKDRYDYAKVLTDLGQEENAFNQRKLAVICDARSSEKIVKELKDDGAATTDAGEKNGDTDTPDDQAAAGAGGFDTDASDDDEIDPELRKVLEGM